MKKLALSAVLLAAFSPLLLAGQTERIRLFDSYITVNADGSMLVCETIEVQAAGQNIRHGIYRDFPTRYYDLLGNQYDVGFQIVGVERNGSSEPYHIGTIDNGVRVYFGDSRFVLPPGTYAYTFTYTTNRQLGFFADHDELYWNVTGNRWQFPIDVATATVVLPEQVRQADLGLDGYTGFRGERGKLLTHTRGAENNPKFRAEHLAPGQGLSIVVSWPKGLILPPSTQQKLNWFAPTYPTYQWRTPIIAATMILNGERVPKEWVLPQPEITSENLDKYVDPKMPPLFYPLCGCQKMPGYPEKWGGKP